MSNNLVGQTFGKLKAVERIRTKTKRGDWGYICECSCGNKLNKVINGSKLKIGYIKDCGCETRVGRKPKVSDDEFKLIVKNSSSLSEALDKCGIKGHDTTAIKKRIKSLNLDISHFNNISRRFNLSINDRYSMFYEEHKKETSKRNLAHDLSLEDFIQLITSECYYCGNPPKQNKKRQIVKHGIDRVNNKNGYLKDNCVPCCKRCNWMKSDMNLQEFVEHLNKIINRIQKHDK